MLFTIEKNIPVKRKGENIEDNFYPFKEMEIGDSFLIPPDSKTDSRRVFSRLSSTMYIFNRAHPGIKMIGRVVDGGIRCWRIS